MSEEVKGVITWLYYQDLPKAMEFYETVLGLNMVVDQGGAKIYKIREGAYVGLVDENRGYHRASDIKPVILCMNVYDADSWYERVRSHDLEIEVMLKESEVLKVKVFMFRDPEGYVIEIQETLPGGLSI
ncbi:MAG TPA: VOC family protein [Patescibacteria group bacterium]|nr:VOC family protein [Patescibacteria group bacterium]